MHSEISKSNTRYERLKAVGIGLIIAAIGILRPCQKTMLLAIGDCGDNVGAEQALTFNHLPDIVVVCPVHLRWEDTIARVSLKRNTITEIRYPDDEKSMQVAKQRETAMAQSILVSRRRKVVELKQRVGIGSREPKPDVGLGG